MKAADGAEQGPPDPGRRRLLRTAAVAVPALIGISATAAAYAFQVPRHQRAVRGLERPVRVAFLTDLHLGPFMGRSQLTEWVEATKRLEPDLILFGGDLVDQAYNGDLSEVRELLPGMTAELGVYAVLGNHDRTKYRQLAPLTRAFEGSGVGLLVNEGVQVRNDLFVAGLDDWRTGQPHFGRTFARAGSGATLLVSHNPDAIPDVPDGADLVLSGHTHGGQVRLPLLGPLVTGSEYGRRFLEGWVDAPMPAFVSRGLGVTLLPFRLFCPPELVLLELVPA